MIKRLESFTYVHLFTGINNKNLHDFSLQAQIALDYMYKSIKYFLSHNSSVLSTYILYLDNILQMIFPFKAYIAAI